MLLDPATALDYASPLGRGAEGDVPAYPAAPVTSHLSHPYPQHLQHPQQHQQCAPVYAGVRAFPGSGVGGLSNGSTPVSAPSSKPGSAASTLAAAYSGGTPVSSASSSGVPSHGHHLLPRQQLPVYGAPSYFGDLESLGLLEGNGTASGGRPMHPAPPPPTPPQQQQQQQRQQVPRVPLLSQSVAGGRHKQFQPISPLIPEEVLLHYHAQLTAYEQREIHDYPEVYFIGAPSIPKIHGPLRKSGADLATSNIQSTSPSGRAASGVGEDKSLHNQGFDDHRGDYYLTKYDHIAYRYEMLSMLGKGSFGVVVKCWDHKRGSVVALKMIRNKKRFEKQGAIEVKVLKRLVENDPKDEHSLIHVLDTFMFRNHLCLTFQLLGINLYEWLKAGSFKGVHLGIVKRIATQLLTSLSLLKRLSIVHADLKPENILLVDTIMQTPSRYDADHTHLPYPPEFSPGDAKYGVKVIDLGSSCLEDERIYTYVQSRFYRSPEVILGIPYNCAIDMWSFGCILAELFTGFPIFPGENETEQLACIMEIRGLPRPELLQRASRRKLFFDLDNKPKLVANSKGRKRTPAYKSMSTALRCKDPVFLDFLDACLDWDPSTRITPQEALQHEFMRYWPKRAQDVVADLMGGVSMMQQQQQQPVRMVPLTPKGREPGYGVGRAMPHTDGKRGPYPLGQAQSTLFEVPSSMLLASADGKGGMEHAGTHHRGSKDLLAVHRPSPSTTARLHASGVEGASGRAKKGSPLDPTRDLVSLGMGLTRKPTSSSGGHASSSGSTQAPLPAHTRGPRTPRSLWTGDLFRAGGQGTPYLKMPSSSTAAAVTLLPPIYASSGLPTTGAGGEGRRATISGELALHAAAAAVSSSSTGNATATTSYPYGEGGRLPHSGVVQASHLRGRKGADQWMSGLASSPASPGTSSASGLHRSTWRV